MAAKPDLKLNWWRKALLGLGARALKAASGQGATASLSLTDPSNWARLLASARSVTGKVVDDESAMRVTTVWACNKVLAESVAMLPWAIYERLEGGNARKLDDHPLADVLVDSPNADMTAQELLEAGQLNLGLHGNAYHLVERAGGRVTSLYPLPATDVVPQRNQETGEISYRWNDRGRWETLPRERVWHVKGFGGNGLVGLSPLGAAREAFGLAMAAEEFQARFFGQGGRPSAVVKVPTWLDEDQRTIARENLQKLLGGLDNAFKFHLLEGGMELEPWGQALDDLQFAELRQLQVREICRIYRVPPHMVADLAQATFNNMEQLSLEFVTYTLMPWLTRWERSAARWLLAPEERRRLFVRFNFEALLRADSAGRAELYSKAVQNGWMTRNEVRAKENMNSAAGLDEFTVQVNLSPIEQLAAAIAARPTAPKGDTIVVNAPVGRAEPHAPHPGAHRAADRPGALGPGDGGARELAILMAD